MSKYKVIAFDMDGTLLDSNKQVKEESLKAIQTAVDAGKEVVLSTGRGICELLEFFEQVKSIRYAVTTSGAVLYDGQDKKVLETYPIAQETAEQIMELSRGKDMMVHFLMPELSVAQRDKIENMAKYSMGVYQQMFEKLATPVDDIYEYYKKNKPVIPKINFYHTSPEAREESKEQAEKIVAEKIYAETASLEFTPPGISKSFGLEMLCRRLGATMDEVIAVGDSENDISMLKAAGLSIAMGNSKQIVKDLADHVVADNDSTGCAEAIYKYLLID